MADEYPNDYSFEHHSTSLSMGSSFSTQEENIEDEASFITSEEPLWVATAFDGSTPPPYTIGKANDVQESLEGLYDPSGILKFADHVYFVKLKELSDKRTTQLCCVGIYSTGPLIEFKKPCVLKGKQLHVLDRAESYLVSSYTTDLSITKYTKENFFKKIELGEF